MEPDAHRSAVMAVTAASCGRAPLPSAQARWVDLWGVNQDAAYEVGRGGELSVVVFDLLPDGLSHANWVATYRSEDWTDVRPDASE
jgi:hypothetical protein